MKPTLPVNQISKGQRSALQRAIEPQTKVMDAHFGSQAGPKAIESLGALPRQAKGVQHFLVDGFDHLAQTRQKASQRFGPAQLLAALMRRRDHHRLILLPPALVRSDTRKTFLGSIAVVC
jgi:hypothetical protein